jgi:spermidine synthase
VVVLDAFDGGYIPAELTTAEFFAGVARVLRPDGILLANVVDGPPAAAYLRRALATICGTFASVVVVADPAVLKVRRFGNVVVVAAAGALPVLDIRRAAARADFPRRVLGGDELSQFVASARPFTDADPLRSPEPPDEIWRVSSE